MLKNSKKGFTLIELLVVIAIIAILAAILFPVFAKARDKARGAACLSNVKQMTLGIMMYKDDYDQTYPPVFEYEPEEFPQGDAWLTNGAEPWCWPWQHLIYQYTKNFQIMWCPNSPEGFTAPYVGWAQYGANVDIIGYPASATNMAAYRNVFDEGVKSEAKVQDPANKYMIMDSGCYGIQWYHGVWGAFGGHYVPGVGGVKDAVNAQAAASWGAINYPSDWTNGRHSGGVNVGYADGHSKFQSGAQIWALTKNTQQNFANRDNASWDVLSPDPWMPRFGN